MKHIFTILCLLSSMLFISCITGYTPKSTTKAFFRAIEEGEFVEALNLTTLADEGDTELYCAIMEKERKSIVEKGGIESVEILSEELSLEDENRTSVTSLITYGNGSTHEEFCEMVKIDNRWKIDVNLNTK